MVAWLFYGECNVKLLHPIVANLVFAVVVNISTVTVFHQSASLMACGQSAMDVCSIMADHQNVYLENEWDEPDHKSKSNPSWFTQDFFNAGK